MDADERHEDWDDSPWSCADCGTSHEAWDECVSTDRGPVCLLCVDAGVVA